MGKLTDGPATGVKLDLRAWCAEQNGKKISRRMGRWYYVATVDGEERIDTLDGTDGDNVRKLIAGELQDFYGWPESRMQGYRRWLWSCAERGLTEPLRIGQREPEPAE